VAQQLVHRVSVLGKHGDPDACRHTTDLVVDREFLCPRLLDLQGHCHGCRQVSGTVGQDRELIPAEPGDRVGLPDRSAKPLSDLLEQPVAVLVPQHVVDLLEPVKVHHQQRPRFVVAMRRRQSLEYQLTEQLAVRQAGESVMQRQMFEILGVRLASGDVAHEREGQAAIADPRLAVLDLHCEG
jgi:hypothetical protein